MLSLVIPVYRNEDNLTDLFEAVCELNRELSEEFEAIFVVDGSPDRCYEILRDTLPSQSFGAKLLLLSRNFGSFAAIRAGLEAGSGERFAVMAADLQEPPALVVEMDHTLRDDEADVIVGVRECRTDPFFTQLSAKIFWSLYRRFVVPDIPPGGVDVFACNRAFRDQLLNLEERHSSLIAQIFWLGFRQKQVGYTRRKRRHGKSAWTLHKKINYLMDSIFSFTDLPIRFLIRIGGASAALSALFGIIIIIARLTGSIEMPGYTATMLALIFFGSLNLFGLGIVGGYAWRAYENTKARPHALVLDCRAFPGSVENKNETTED